MTKLAVFSCKKMYWHFAGTKKWWSHIHANWAKAAVWNLDSLSSFWKKLNMQVYLIYSVLCIFSVRNVVFLAYLLEAQIHNATQLESWCIHFIATHYNAVCQQCPKHVKNFDSSTLKSIETKRWPPPWYIAEADWYEKAIRELDNEKVAEKLRKSHKHIRHKRKCSCLWEPLYNKVITVLSLQWCRITTVCFTLCISK